MEWENGEKNMRLIDGDRLFEIFKNGMIRIPSIEENRNMFYHNSGYNCAMTGAYIEVEKAPTIEAVSVDRNKIIDEFAERCKEHILCKTFGLHHINIDEIAEQMKGGAE